MVAQLFTADMALLWSGRKGSHLHGLWAAGLSLGSPAQKVLTVCSYLLDVPGHAHARLGKAAQRTAQLLLQRLRVLLVCLLCIEASTLQCHCSERETNRSRELHHDTLHRYWQAARGTYLERCRFIQPTASSIALCRTSTPVCIAFSASSPSSSCPRYLDPQALVRRGAQAPQTTHCSPSGDRCMKGLTVRYLR